MRSHRGTGHELSHGTERAARLAARRRADRAACQREGAVLRSGVRESGGRCGRAFAGDGIDAHRHGRHAVRRSALLVRERPRRAVRRSCGGRRRLADHVAPARQRRRLSHRVYERCESCQRQSSRRGQTAVPRADGLVTAGRRPDVRRPTRVRRRVAGRGRGACDHLPGSLADRAGRQHDGRPREAGTDRRSEGQRRRLCPGAGGRAHDTRTVRHLRRAPHRRTDWRRDRHDGADSRLR